jgi:hypothetical protein
MVNLRGDPSVYEIHKAEVVEFEVEEGEVCQIGKWLRRNGNSTKENNHEAPKAKKSTADKEE